MTTRRAIVRIGGVNRELPVGDTLAGGIRMAFSCVNKPNAGEVVGFYVVEEAFTIPDNFAGSIGRALTPPSAGVAWTLTKIPAGSSAETTIATATVATDGSVTFSIQAAVSLAVGDIVRMKAPASQDSAMSDIAFTIAGVR